MTDQIEGVQTNDLSDVMAKLRIALGESALDVNETADCCGIFNPSNKHDRTLIGHSLTSLLSGLLEMERTYFTDEKIPSVKRQALASLVSFFARVCYWPKSTDDINELKGRFSLTKCCSTYLPHNPGLHGTAINPPGTGDFSLPARIKLKVADKEFQQCLLVEFFPVAYGHYPNHRELTGASPPEAKEALLTRYRDGRRVDAVNAIVSQAEQTYIPAHLRLQLEAATGQKQAEIIGVLAQQGEAKGLELFCQSQPELSVFIPLAGKSAKANPEQLLCSMAKNFLKLQLKDQL